MAPLLEKRVGPWVCRRSYHGSCAHDRFLPSGGDPSHPDYAYFSQFRSDSRDGFQPSPNSDYRPMEELLRRRIKPAWIQYFNVRTGWLIIRPAPVLTEPRKP